MYITLHYTILAAVRSIQSSRPSATCLQLAVHSEPIEAGVLGIAVIARDFQFYELILGGCFLVQHKGLRLLLVVVNAVHARVQ